MHNYSDSISILLEKFPALKPIYEEGIYDYEDLPYVFYESVFVRYITDKAKSFDEVELSNIFNFVEELLVEGDEELKNLIGVAVIESLYHEKHFCELNMLLSKFYGDLTKMSFDDCLTG